MKATLNDAEKLTQRFLHPKNDFGFMNPKNDFDVKNNLKTNAVHKKSITDMSFIKAITTSPAGLCFGIWTT